MSRKKSSKQPTPAEKHPRLAKWVFKDLDRQESELAKYAFCAALNHSEAWINPGKKLALSGQIYNSKDHANGEAHTTPPITHLRHCYTAQKRPRNGFYDYSQYFLAETNTGETYFLTLEGNKNLPDGITDLMKHPVPEEDFSPYVSLSSF